MKNIIASSLGLLVLAGCAAQPQKIALSSADYDYAARALYAAHSCGISGKISPEKSGQAKQFIIQRLQQTNVDTDLLQQRITALGSPEVPQEACNKVLMDVAQAGGNESAKPSPAAPAARPTYTRCSTYFGQTHCTTY